MSSLIETVLFSCNLAGELFCLERGSLRSFMLSSQIYLYIFWLIFLCALIFEDRDPLLAFASSPW